MPQIEEALPKYVQIARHLRDRNLRGDMQPGDEVPSERQLASDWSVSRPTAAGSLEALRQQGLVEKRQGSGTYVRDSRCTGGRVSGTGVPRTPGRSTLRASTR